jgi:LuxR family maltose regulon positive regulatory protein
MLEDGRRALARGEWLEAQHAFERALASEPGDPDVLEGLGWAHFWLDENDASFDCREEAYRIFLSRQDARSAARVAMWIAVDSADLRGTAVTAGWIERARRHLDGLEVSEEHGWLHLWEGHLARSVDQDLELAAAKAREALAIARQFGLADLEMLANALEGLVMVTAGEVRDGMRRLDEATAAAVAGEICDLDSIATTCCFLVHACERVRDYDRAAQWGERIGALAQRWRVGTVFALCRAEHAAMLVGRGEWEAAEKDLLQSVEVLERSRPLTVGDAIVQLGELRRRQGRFDEALQLFARIETNTLAILGTAAIALERGDALRCADLVERFRRRNVGEKWVERAMSLELLVRARIALGEAPDGPLVEEPLAAMRALAERVGTEPIRAIAASSEAVVAVARGADDRARELLEDALDLHERSRAPWDAARTRVELVPVLRRLGREPFAREELAAAIAAFTRLGAHHDAGRAAALLDASLPIKGARSPLTPRETDVLRLVAQGMSDKEAAHSLGLSEHTVHRHVANILAKLGASSRAAAAAEATREGWV